MQILIFVSKRIGLSLLKQTLIAQDDIFLVLGNDDRDLLMDFAIKSNIPFIEIENYRAEDFQKKSFDWILNLWSPFIFRKEDLELGIETLNVHPSYLPIARGRDPIIHSVLSNNVLGVTFHRITIGIDEGPIFHQVSLDYRFPFTGAELYKRVIELCIAEWSSIWPKIRQKTISSVEQKKESTETNTRRRTEELRVKLWKDFSPEEKNLLQWLCVYNFNADYCAVIEIDEKRFMSRLVFEEI